MSAGGFNHGFFLGGGGLAAPRFPAQGNLWRWGARARGAGTAAAARAPLPCWELAGLSGGQGRLGMYLDFI